MKYLKYLGVILILISMSSMLTGCGSSGVQYYTYDPGDAFITSVADSKSLFKTDITIELSNKESVDFLTKNNYKVRDIIINILRNETLDDIEAADSQDTIKKKIVKALKNDLSVNGIDNIYFNEFVVQQ